MSLCVAERARECALGQRLCQFPAKFGGNSGVVLGFHRITYRLRQVVDTAGISGLADELPAQFGIGERDRTDATDADAQTGNPGFSTRIVVATATMAKSP